MRDGAARTRSTRTFGGTRGGGTRSAPCMFISVVDV
jgi:hypothetical protein